MTNTITQLWQGTLNPMRHFAKGNQEIKHLETLMQRNLDTLEKNLPEAAKEHFENYNRHVEEYNLAIIEQAFRDGFCLGGKLVAEAVVGADQLA